MRLIKLSRVISAAEYLLVFIVIINNYTMFERDTLYGISESRMCFIFSMLCVGITVLYFIIRDLRFNVKNTSGIVLMTLFSFITTVVPGGVFIPGIVKWVVPFFTFSFVCLCQKDTKDIWIKFADVVCAIAALSLILYISGTVLHLISPSRMARFLYDSRYARANTYFNFQYEAQHVQGDSFMGIEYRNCCFFIEAPMYNLMLCIGFAAEAAFRDKPRRIVLAIIGVSILTTFSTTGILFLMLMFVIYLWNTGNTQIIKYLKLAMIPIAAIAVVVLAMKLIESKQESAAGGESFSVRLDHLIASVKMWIHNPILGYGFDNPDAFYRFAKYKQGFSVGLPAFLGRTGLPMFLLYLVPFILRVYNSMHRNRRELFFWAGTFLCFLLTASVYKLIFLFLICTQFIWNEDKNNNNRKKVMSLLQEVLKD